ncbi:hypothetical protein DFH09DRAFT_1107183 [Mycena vulgaris]|nr:hypothetical protein DFH09DRAFT_1107183 [Mycena vulgaris]
MPLLVHRRNNHAPWNSVHKALVTDVTGSKPTELMSPHMRVEWGTVLSWSLHQIMFRGRTGEAGHDSAERVVGMGIDSWGTRLNWKDRGKHTLWRSTTKTLRTGDDSGKESDSDAEKAGAGGSIGQILRGKRSWWWYESGRVWSQDDIYLHEWSNDIIRLGATESKSACALLRGGWGRGFAPLLDNALDSK